MFRRTEPAPSRLAREGWVPAGPDKRVNDLIFDPVDVVPHRVILSFFVGKSARDSAPS